MLVARKQAIMLVLSSSRIRYAVRELNYQNKDEASSKDRWWVGRMIDYSRKPACR